MASLVKHKVFSSFLFIVAHAKLFSGGDTGEEGIKCQTCLAIALHQTNPVQAKQGSYNAQGATNNTFKGLRAGRTSDKSATMLST